VDILQDYIKFEIKDANHKGLDLGRLELSFLEFCEVGETEQWYRLNNENGEDLPSTICLLFEIRGAKEKCSMCSIFIGNEPFTYLFSEMIHLSCLVCIECGKPKTSPDFYHHNGRLYDSACYDRKFGIEQNGTNDHNWNNISIFYPNFSCSYCGLPLGKDNIWSCQDCLYSCHNDCKLKAHKCGLISDSQGTSKLAQSLNLSAKIKTTITPKRKK